MRIILSKTFAKDNSIDVEKPLQQAFEGHCNWQHPLLASFFTALVSVAGLLELAAKGRFHLSSYRCLAACNGCMCVRGGAGGNMWRRMVGSGFPRTTPGIWGYLATTMPDG